MIKTLRHKGLKNLFLKGAASGLPPKSVKRIAMILDLLDHAASPEDTDAPGLRFHRLKGNPTRYALWVDENYRVTFEWDGEHAFRVDFEDYHGR